MKTILFMLLITLMIIAINAVTAYFYKPSEACSDYLLIGRTYDQCITDKRVHE